MQLFYTPDIKEKTHTLSELESKHCIRVLRKKHGEFVYLIDGIGGFYKTKIIEDNPKKCKVEIIETIKDFKKRDFHLHIAIAPTKNIEKTEWFLEKVTELGIDEITPILCKNSERKIIKLDRLNKIIVSAAKQSIRAYLPKLNEFCKFEDFVKIRQSELQCIAYCSDGKKKLFKELCKEGKNVLIMIGPEGDFTNDEIELALNNEFVNVSLGENRLRTETAGIAACMTANFINNIY